jgi:outer membrane murein-binding lipoprotein Lpp
VQSSDGDWEFVGRPGDILTRIEELEAKQDRLSNEVAKLRLLVGIPELEAKQEQLSNEVASG